MMMASSHSEVSLLLHLRVVHWEVMVPTVVSVLYLADFCHDLHTHLTCISQGNASASSAIDVVLFMCKHAATRFMINSSAQCLGD